MILLEIAMIVIGLGAVIYSFHIADTPTNRNNSDSQYGKINADKIDETLQSRIEEFEEKIENSFLEADDRLSELSNEKIIGMSEYSDQVLDKIEKNHAEVVFLYDMLNEKQEEIKKLITDTNSIKADLQNEAAKEYQKLKEQEQELDELRKELQVEFLSSPTQKEDDFSAILSDSERENAIDEFQELLEGSKVEEIDEDSKASVYDAEIARIEAEEAMSQSESKYQPYNENEEIVNNNEEIITLYKKGRSILEISKMLSLGQGEVKFVIDLYNAR